MVLYSSFSLLFTLVKNIDNSLDLVVLVNYYVKEWHEVEDERSIDSSGSLVEHFGDLAEKWSLRELHVLGFVDNFWSIIVIKNVLDNIGGVLFDRLIIVDFGQANEETDGEIWSNSGKSIGLGEEDDHVDELEDEAEEDLRETHDEWDIWLVEHILVVHDVFDDKLALLELSVDA